jgi:hypothetical protein
LALAVLLAILSGAVLDRLRGAGEARLVPEQVQRGFGPKTFAEAIARADRELARARALFR